MVLNVCNNLCNISQITNINPPPPVPSLLYRYTFVDTTDISTNGYALNRATGLYDGSFVGLAHLVNISTIGNGSGHVGNTTGKALNPGSYTDNGITFNNYNSYLLSNYIPSSSALSNGLYSTADTPRGITISCWIYMMNYTPNIFFTFHDAVNNYFVIDLEIGTSVGSYAGHLYTHDNPEFNQFNTNTNTDLFPLGKWSHFAISFQYSTSSNGGDGKITIYSNGKYYGTNGTQTGATNPDTVTTYTYNIAGATTGNNPYIQNYAPHTFPHLSSTSLRIGWTVESSFYYGRLCAFLDDFRIYDGILVQSQINKIYNGTI